MLLTSISTMFALCNRHFPFGTQIQTLICWHHNIRIAHNVYKDLIMLASCTTSSQALLKGPVCNIHKDPLKYKYVCI